MKDFTKDRIDAQKAAACLPQSRDPNQHGESLEIMRHTKPVTHAVPAEDSSEHALKAAARLRQLRREVRGVPLAKLIKTIHEGHRW